jgi:hypothetical protein
MVYEDIIGLVALQKKRPVRRIRMASEVTERQKKRFWLSTLFAAVSGCGENVQCDGDAAEVESN